MVFKRLDYIKQLGELYTKKPKRICKKEVKKLLNNQELLIFNKYVELKKLQTAKKINRKMFRTLLIEYVHEIHIKELQLDYVGDTLDLHSKVHTIVEHKKQVNGEINNCIVGMRKRKGGSIVVC